MTAKYGLPYFQNFLNSELKPNMVRSMCCRLQLDLRELLKRGNGLFGSAEQTGSLGVVTINCARLGYLYAGDEIGLFERLDALLGYAHDSLEVKRKVIQRHIDQGLFPYTKRYLGTLRNHFSTIGVNGINEMIRNFTGDDDDITTPEGHAFAVRLLDHVRARIVAFQEETGHLYNLEATPAEGTTYRFARRTASACPDILQAGTRGDAVLHQLIAAAGGLHRRPVRGADAAGGAADASTPAARCCTSTWASGSPRSRRARSWCGARWSASACPTSPSRRRSRSARSTATSTASTSSARSATRSALAEKRAPAGRADARRESATRRDDR